MSSDNNTPDSAPHDVDDRLEALAERVAKLEVHTGLSTTAPDGSRVSFEQLLALGLTRRQAIAALGFVAAGATITAAISRALGTVQPEADTRDTDTNFDEGPLDVQSISTEEQRIVNEERDSEFVWTIDSDDLVLEGVSGNFLIQNPVTEVNDEKRAIVYEGGTFENASFVELDYGSTEPALGHGAEAVERSVSYGRWAGRENEEQQNVNIGDRAGDGSSGQRNVFVGREAGRDVDGEENVFVGRAAGRNVVANHNALVGSRIARDSEVDESAGVGQEALEDAIGQRIHVLGSRAGHSANSDSSIFVGHRAGEDCEANVVYAFGDDVARDWDEDYTMLVGDDDGNLVLKLDLEEGDLELAGELTENVDL